MNAVIKNTEELWNLYWTQTNNLEWMRDYMMPGWTGNEFITLRAMESDLENPESGLSNLVRDGAMHLFTMEQARHLLKNLELLPILRRLSNENRNQKIKDGIGILYLRPDITNPRNFKPVIEFDRNEPFLAVLTYRRGERILNWRLSAKKRTIENILKSLNVTYLLVKGGSNLLKVASLDILRKVDSSWTEMKEAPKTTKTFPNRPISLQSQSFSILSGEGEFWIPPPDGNGENYTNAEWLNYANEIGWKGAWNQTTNQVKLWFPPGGWGLRFLDDKNKIGLTKAIETMKYRLRAIRTLADSKNSAIKFLLEKRLLHMYTDDEIDLKLDNVANLPFSGNPESQEKKNRKFVGLNKLRMFGVGMIRFRTGFPANKHNEIFNPDPTRPAEYLYAVRDKRRGKRSRFRLSDDGSNIINNIRNFQRLSLYDPPGPEYFLAEGGNKIIFFSAHSISESRYDHKYKGPLVWEYEYDNALESKWVYNNS